MEIQKHCGKLAGPPSHGLMRPTYQCAAPDLGATLDVYLACAPLDLGCMPPPLYA